tara:strand:- start:371 stop:517 length:147 start_codon:yes stop_codon:yes gene_type:complete
MENELNYLSKLIGEKELFIGGLLEKDEDEQYQLELLRRISDYIATRQS